MAEIAVHRPEISSQAMIIILPYQGYIAPCNPFGVLAYRPIQTLEVTASQRKI